MYRYDHCVQLSFQVFFIPLLGQSSGEKCWIKLADVILWDELENTTVRLDFARLFGALPPLLCKVLATLIIKVRLGLIDDELVDQIKQVVISSSALSWTACCIQPHLIH